MQTKKTHLLIIDPQNDFCEPDGSLYVPGANKDMERISKFIIDNNDNIDFIHVTLDSHNLIDIAHPIFWINEDGNFPDPFSIISVDDVMNGVWTTTNPNWKQRALSYVQALAVNGRYPLCIWPPHCLIGSFGHAIANPIQEALIVWQSKNMKPINFISKGSNIFTEHYSAIKADVVDPLDRSTDKNSELLNQLNYADEIIVAGEALSHCVANTVIDIVEHEESTAKKIVLLSNATSSVPGFEELGDKFISDMVAKGMTTREV